ncbi:unnamed protein product [Rotaria sp. Silwood1]|nr:unnamed protein product [Rotaria sp. Silwood1]CAF1651403.1 unnamed protein product [Rotaria sp. Silwood1]
MLIPVISLLIIIETRVIIGRPSFNSIFHATANKLKTFDSITGLPAHSNVFRQTIDIDESSTLRGKSLSTNIRRIKLNSSAKLDPKICIALDAIESLESVQCIFGSRQQLVLAFKSSADARFLYNKWLVSGAKFVNGGPVWDCRNVTTQETIIIFQRISTFRIKNIQVFIETYKDTNISPLICFTNISMHLTWEQGSVTTGRKTTSPSQRQTKVPVANLKSLRSSWSFDPQRPLGDEIFYTGQTIEVSWSYSNMDPKTSLEIVLYRKQLLFDAEINKITTQMNILQLSFVIPATLEASSNDQYYFKFRFSRSLISYWKSSALFYIPTLPSIIPREPPAINEVFYPGDIVPLSWQNVNFVAASQITVRFRRARPIIPDANLATFTVLATANAYNFTIPTSLDRADNDKYYYFEFDYCTSWLSLNCKKTTNNFFVPLRPYVRPTFPGVDDWFSPLQTVILEWISANFANVNDLLTIKLRRSNYLLPDSDIDTFTCTVNSSGSCSWTLPVVEKSFSSYYFEFNWCKHWYSTDCTAKSNQFSIPTHAIGSWNYDEQRSQALASKTLYSASCNTMCPTSDIELLYICQMCGKGRSIGMQVNCTNCWATFDYSIVQIEIERKDNSPSLDKIVVRMNSHVSVNLDFSIWADYQHSFDGWLPLPSIPIGPSIQVSIGSLSFGVGLFFAPSISWNITVDAIGNLTAGVDYQWQTNLTLISTPGNTSKEYTQNLTRNIHPMQGNFQANLLVDFAYRPALALQVGIFTVDLGTDGYIIFESVWRYPPFAALSTSNFDWNTQKIAPFHVSLPSNSCLTTHFIHYHTMCGIRNTQISIGFDQLSDLVNIFTDFDLSLSTRSLFDLGPYELSSGCMYQANLNTDTYQTVYLILNRQFTPINNTSDTYLSRAVVNDLAYALAVSQIRFYYNNTFSVEQNRMTGIAVVFLPSTSASTSDPTVMIMVQWFRDQAINFKSLLYSGLVTSLLNITQTFSINGFDSSKL